VVDQEHADDDGKPDGKHDEVRAMATERVRALGKHGRSIRRSRVLRLTHSDRS
jgi:hypothetical protein